MTGQNEAQALGLLFLSFSSDSVQPGLGAMALNAVPTNPSTVSEQVYLT